MQINRITVKKDGVYISARDPEEPGAFRSRLSEKLTKAYREGGQRWLDQKIFELDDSMQIELRGATPVLNDIKIPCTPLKQKRFLRIMDGKWKGLTRI